MEFFLADFDVWEDSADFAADDGKDGFLEDDLGDGVGVEDGGVLVEEVHGFRDEAFSGEHEDAALIFFGAGVELGEVKGANFFGIDRLGEFDSIDFPTDSVGEDHPFNALVCSVIDGLAEVGIVEFDAGGFDFDEEADGVVDADGEITEGSADLLLAGEFGVFVEAEDVCEDVFDEGDGIGFGDVADAVRFGNFLEVADGCGCAFDDFFGDDKHGFRMRVLGWI